MSEKDLNKQAFKQAEEELQEEKVAEVKEVMKSILQSIQRKTEEKAKIEESLRLLKLDMEDLKVGKLDKIRERHATTKKEPEFDLAKLKKIADERRDSFKAYGSGGSSVMYLTTGTSFNDAVSGTYTISCSNGTTREFYL